MTDRTPMAGRLGALDRRTPWAAAVSDALVAVLGPWVELMRLVDGLERHGLYGYLFSDPLAPHSFLHGCVALAFVAPTPSIFTGVGPALGAYVAASPIY